MFYPALKKYTEKYRSVDSFSGLYHTSLVPEGSFYDCKNLSADKVPLMSVREKRGILKSADGGEIFYFDSTPITAVKAVNSKICVCTSRSVFVSGQKVENAELDSSVSDRTIVPFGRDFYICPDGIFVKDRGEGFEAIECNKSFCLKDGVRAGYATEDSTEVFPTFFGAFPSSANIGDMCAKADGIGMALYEYTGDAWVRIEKLYIRIGFRDEISGLTEGMSVNITTPEKLFSDGTYTVKGVFPAAVLLDGVLTAEGILSEVNLESRVPVMDYAVEHGNRIWGCRFGENREGEFVNELYASALGDPTSWNRYDGISTDSYTVSLGVHGKFTGAVSLGGEVLFFKENHIIRVSGDTPAEFTVSAFPARGVEAGQSGSVCNLNERVFYKNSSGITVYDSALPVNISKALGTGKFSGCTGAGERGRYYCAMTDSEGERRIYVFDIDTGMWFSEDDNENTVMMFTSGALVYFVGLRDTEGFGYSLSCNSFKNAPRDAVGFSPETGCRFCEENSIFWFAETGKSESTAYPYRQKVRNIKLRVSVGKDSVFRVLISPDSREDFIPVLFLERPTDGIFTAHISTVPCHSFRLRFEGKGDVTLYSYCAVSRNESEVKNIE